MTLGRNQKIGIIGAALPYMMNYALVLAGKLDAAAFWSGTWPYVGAALAIILGASAYVKTRQPEPAK